ncbi:uncharacterized protein PV06_08611 [Exophiala oligosperma]|uniref:Cupin 2 conserved barrel domain-containing protein n=2 Tax=Chaetothyriales TaxID=34395 RepID=A0A0D2DAD6_9EURO|nr:uncharacterized protein PV06_08611 [Exophiala oligosperma]KAJ9641312.1 hypothetical protein H2204_002990 [Knufia peltigerae]KIW40058.1 hypothetical protein PV06_08611 [Exophiala oligosperma]
MDVVQEIITSWPKDEDTLEVQRREELLFQQPSMGPVKLRSHEPIQAVHFASAFKPIKFARPAGIYESHHLRVEWQTMANFRQPFYHRNADVDELSYQVCGTRTLMTEYGTVDLEPGDFTRIPVGVAHDNYGIDDIHLLFYIPAPVKECGPIVRRAEARDLQFEGWAPKAIPEVMTLCLGGPECDIAASLVDETLLLEHAKHVDQHKLIPVLRPHAEDRGTSWLYKSEFVWVGHTERNPGEQPAYYRHRFGDEIQCQISGTRTVVTQRGVIDLEPGDYICIPTGVPFTDIAHEKTMFISILTHHESPPVAPITKTARPATFAEIQKLRGVHLRNGE